MNLIEAQKVNEAVKLLDKVLKGKVEYLPEAKQAKEILTDLIEFKNIEAWKFALDDQEG